VRALLDLTAPIACVCCGRHGEAELCARCAEDLRPLVAPLCLRCGAPAAAELNECDQCRDLEGFGRARSLVVYAEPARSLTLVLKRRGRRALARSIGGLAARLAEAHGLVSETHVVTFVPAPKRARRVGFDHAELIARATARTIGCPVRRALVRVGGGPRQADVPFADRRDNVRRRFAPRPIPRPITGPVLLVDDVFTTGATAEACSIALLQAGATSVDVVTWARTLRRRSVSILSA
jgi:predicted amidophosphoribosyltransferase